VLGISIDDTAVMGAQDVIWSDTIFSVTRAIRPASSARDDIQMLQCQDARFQVFRAPHSARLSPC